MIEQIHGEASAQRQGDLVAPPPVVLAACEHLGSLTDVPVPATPGGCAECLRDGTEWVHLRMCLSCGHVGCCDSSPQRHADAHFRTEGHPVIRSFESGEGWRWCFADEMLG